MIILEFANQIVLETVKDKYATYVSLKFPSFYFCWSLFLTNVCFYLLFLFLSHLLPRL